MKILSPLNKVSEAEILSKAGADEFYCGILPRQWLAKYTNMASANRREWRSSNLQSFDELREVIEIAHKYGRKVYLTLNAFYSEKQYPLILKQAEEAIKYGVDAFIIADIGLILKLKELGWRKEIHISTGGVVFNLESIDFYKNLGASRITIPRHTTAEEIVFLAKNSPLPIDIFILNRGCKNIDGFCTFQHGVNEVKKVGTIWNLGKRLSLDQRLLIFMKRLPEDLAMLIARSNFFGSVGACFLSYEIIPHHKNGRNPEEEKNAVTTLKKSFNLMSGLDTCGACDLLDFYRAGVHSVKIVGRSNFTAKKERDVIFIRTVIDKIKDNPDIDKNEYIEFAKNTYKKIYKINCKEICYYGKIKSKTKV